MPQSMISEIIQNVTFSRPSIIELKNSLFDQMGVSVSMLRLDNIHPVISGNKIFKLYYYLSKARENKAPTLVTFGGAYSNHLAATSFACKQNNLHSIAYIRGEQLTTLSPTLLFCRENGMELQFISRNDYKHIQDESFLKKMKIPSNHITIPEGGFSDIGAKGAEKITTYFEPKLYSHICVSVGTATTFAGIINGVADSCTTIGFSALKGINDLSERFSTLEVNPIGKYEFNTDYHFGGYAKKNSALINFMNEFYLDHNIPLDFVYTGKMMFGTMDLVRKKHFGRGAQILCVHTGGLQGNQSLIKGELVY